MIKTAGYCFSIILALIITGCSSITRAEQPAVHELVRLDHSRSYGQTFTARFDGLDGIKIYLDTLGAGEGHLQVYLRQDVQNPDNLAVASVPLSEFPTPGFYHINLPGQAHSNQEDYYLLLKVNGSGSVEVGTAPGDSYLNGSLYQDNLPQDDKQMAFKLSYYNISLLLGLANEVLLWCGYLFVSLFIFVIPGWAILGLLWSKENNDSKSYKTLLEALRYPIAKTIIAIGISLSLYPIILLWTNLFHLNFGSWYAWLPAIVGSLYLIWRSITQWRQRSIKLSFPKLQLVDVILFLLVILIIVTRFWVIRSLPLPLWGDSYHHTMIAQLMIENQGLFDDWAPYTDALTFTYHFGFHTFVSIFHWITGISAAQSTLIVGQLINIFAVLVLYPLATLIFKNKWSGVIAILFAGLLSPMPMFYVNWGRYTQLAGHILLIIGVWLTWIIFKTQKQAWRLLIPTWMVISSLAMTHYRVIIFYLAFIVAYFFLRLRKSTLVPFLKKFFWIGLGAGVIFFPWFLNVFGGRILKLFRTLITDIPGSAGNYGMSTIPIGIGDLSLYLPIGIWLLSLIVLAVCLWQRKMAIAITSLWFFLLVLLANPHWLNMPGKGLIDNFAVFIAAYIPVSMIFSVIPEWFNNKMQFDDPKPNATKLIIAGLVIALGLVGAWQKRSTVDPQNYALAANPDIRAADWITENISKESNFLVNAFFAFQDTTIVGSDGGWWLPLLAKRQTMLPPITYAFESEPIPGYSYMIQEPTRAIQKHGISDPRTISILDEHQITHVYIGQKQGSVNSQGSPVLDPIEMMNSAHFKLLYHQDRVWIFRFLP